MVPIAIGPAEREQIYAHARRAFPAECCGYLTGATHRVVDVVVECRNAQEDGDWGMGRAADRGFVIAGRELLAFAKSFDGQHPARVVYHSHTNGRAYFSDVDQELARGPAYPVQHLVVGVTSERVTEAAQFAWSASAGAYVEIARWTVAAAGGAVGDS